MKSIVIGGVPATGKTTLMRFFLELFSSRRPVKHGLVYGYLLQGNILVVGKYEQEQVFAGTDRLSMAVQPDFDIVLESRQYNLMFEGDRLFIEKNLQKLCEPVSYTHLTLPTIYSV